MTLKLFIRYLKIYLTDLYIDKGQKMKIKITLLFPLLIGVVLSEDIADTTAIKEEPVVTVVDQKINVVKSDLEKLNKTIFVLDSLLRTNQTHLNEKIGQLEKSITEQTTNFVLKIKQQNSFNESFLKARLELGKNQEFEWNSKRYSTNYPDESQTPPLVLEIEAIKANLEEKAKKLDDAIIKANTQINTLDAYFEKVNTERENQIITLDQEINKTISDRTLYWIVAILILLIILIAVFFFFRSKVAQQQDSLSLVKDTQGKLEKETIQLDTKLIRILEQKLKIENLQQLSTNEINHSLPLKVAGEIQRIRNRLKHMPQEEQATKVIRNRVESLEEAIKDMEYEIPKFEGKPFVDGLKMLAHFVNDESLNEDEQIISRVIKPQVNFKNQMIQSAEVEVRQGI